MARNGVAFFDLSKVALSVYPYNTTIR